MKKCDVCGRNVDYLTFEYGDDRCNRCHVIENIQYHLDLRLCSFTGTCDECGTYNALYHFKDPTGYLCPKCARSFMERAYQAYLDS